MPNRLFKIIALITGVWLAVICQACATQTAATQTAVPQIAASQIAAPTYQVVISVPDQRLAVVRDGEWVARFPVSTSQFGTGDNFYSYKTPLGDLKVCDKIGENLPPGAVIRHRAPTGEVLPVNAPGRDPIVTRVIWLDGLEAQNTNARSRGIYIHGTPQEWTIGRPMSWGCIRMRSRDVIKFFDEIPVGTVVSIIPNKLPRMHRYEPPKQLPPPPPQPDNNKPAEPAPVSLIAAAKPRAASAKPVPESPKPSATPETTPPAPLPAIGESPDRGTASAWRAMKGSFLLANLPGSEKLGDHRKKTVQATQ
jgi:lipoprotein-anchoring transpeptidase ErfK/SrfK